MCHPITCIAFNLKDFVSVTGLGNHAMMLVTLTYLQGSILRFDCTFDLDDVVEEMEVDQSFRIQSVSAIPKHAAGNSESVYAADASNLDEVREVREGGIL